MDLKQSISFSFILTLITSKHVSSFTAGDELVEVYIYLIIMGL